LHGKLLVLFVESSKNWKVIEMTPPSLFLDFCALGVNPQSEERIYAPFQEKG